jgi:DNA-binding MarR family transcriptional regulator
MALLTNGRLSPIERLVMLALRDHDNMTIGQLIEFAGSTPYGIQQRCAKMSKRGLIHKYKSGGVTYYSMTAPTVPPTTIPAESASAAS